jgi:transposase
MEPFHEDKAVPIHPNQDRDLLAYLQHALGDFTHGLRIERLSTLHRHIFFRHEVRQVPPAYAKPFRQGHKNDFRDAHAVAEAVQRPSTRCVPVKTDDQLDLQALHRVRSRLIGERTAVTNQIRSFLLERGIPTTSIRIIRTGSIEGRPICE